MPATTLTPPNRSECGEPRDVKLRRLAAACLLLLPWLNACSPSGPPATEAAGLERPAFTACRIEHVDSPAQCVQLEVPADHAVPDGAKLKIHVALIPSLARRKAPDPVVLLAGGPGQAASDLGRLVQALHILRRSRDIVLVDQRGTGKTNTLGCAPLDTLKREDWDDLRRLDEAFVQREWKQCLATLRGDPRVHRTDDYVADLESVRKALGIRQWNLWGGSYGSRVALRYLKRHPEAIRTAVLDGVAPTAVQIPEDLLAESSALLDRAFADCAASPSCNAAHPDLAARYERLIERLARTPLKIRETHPATGEPLEFWLDDRVLTLLLWPLLYTPETVRLIPQILAQVENGRVAPLLAVAFDGPIDPGRIGVLMRFAVLCAEDMARSPGRAVPARFAAAAAQFRAACEGLPVKPVAAEFFEPTRSEVPTLLLSGSHDPVTPPAYAAEAGKTLTRHRHLVVEGMGHIVSHHPCLTRVIARFIEQGDHPSEPLTCEAELKLPLPHFFVSPRIAAP
ncbi:MAG: alpha/beta fold hydrolase [Burkholderiales bacterium]|nr:alpha/beta fold hydrolase [Burkholderiales bacterium]